MKADDTVLTLFLLARMRASFDGFEDDWTLLHGHWTQLHNKSPIFKFRITVVNCKTDHTH